MHERPHIESSPEHGLPQLHTHPVLDHKLVGLHDYPTERAAREGRLDDADEQEYALLLCFTFICLVCAIVGLLTKRPVFTTVTSLLFVLSALGYSSIRRKHPGRIFRAFRAAFFSEQRRLHGPPEYSLRIPVVIFITVGLLVCVLEMFFLLYSFISSLPAAD